MSEEQRPTDEAWREVGKQFQTLGESLAAAFRSTAQDAQTRQYLQNMKGGLEAMVKEVNQMISEANVSAKTQGVRQEAEKAAQSARLAADQAMQDARPHLLSALRQVNAELQSLIGRLEPKEPPVDTTGGQE